MHPYSTDLDKRGYVPLTIAIVSIIAAWLLSTLLTTLRWSVPWWVDAPSVLAFYGFFSAAFEKRLWRTSVIRPLLGIPNLNGTYKGYISSSFDKHHSKHPATLEIRQTWKEISVIMTTENSSGQSTAASLNTETGIFSYEYLNEPKPGTASTMHCHRGTGALKITSEDHLEGEYYSGRDRQTYGLLDFVRAKNEN
jgi:hypothetical protein